MRGISILLSKNIPFSKEGIKKLSFFLKSVTYSHFHGKEVEWGASFYYWQTFLIMSNMNFLTFCIELIYMLFGNNNLVWNLQLCYVGLLAELSISSSIICCCSCYYFNSFYKNCFSLEWDFFCKPKGVFIISSQCFKWNKIRKYIQNSFV